MSHGPGSGRVLTPGPVSGISKELEALIQWRAGNSDLTGSELVSVIHYALGRGNEQVPQKHLTGRAEFRILAVEDQVRVIREVLYLTEAVTLRDAADAMARVIREGFLGDTRDNVARARVAGFSDARKWGRAVLATYDRIRAELDEEDR
jgi:hypothetical protein